MTATRGLSGMRRRTQRPTPMANTDAPPTVSVVIPHHNYGVYLPASVSSVLAQQGVSVDVIIVDDASRSEHLDVARQIASHDPRVQLIERRTNGGPVTTFNAGLEAAQGKYLVRLDADDLLTPGSLERAVCLLEAEPTVGLCYGRPRHFVDGTSPRPRTKLKSWTIWPGVEWLERRCRSGYNCITSPEVVMRKSVVDAVGGQRPLRHTHDMEMWMRLAAVSNVGYVKGPDQALHREHAASLSAQQVDMVVDLTERAAAFDVLFEGVGANLKEAARLNSLARRTLAKEAVWRACHEYDRGRATSPRVAQFIALSVQLSPEVRDVGLWRRLASHQMRSKPVNPLAPPQVWRALRRRLQDERMRVRWSRNGV